MRDGEQGVTFWEVCLSLTLLLGWVGVLVPFVEAGNERVARLEMTVRIYERLQGEVVKDADEPGGRLAVCEGDHCLPTL